MKKLLVYLVIAGIGLAGVAYWLSQRGDDSPPTVDYVLAEVEYGAIVETVNGTGVLRPRKVYLVGSEMSGKVVQLKADFNQIVEEGEILLRLDDRVARGNLKQATLTVAAAEKAEKQAAASRDSARTVWRREDSRSQELRNSTDVELAHNQFRVAEAVFEAARVKVEQARAARELAELALKMTVVRAPILDTSSPMSSPSAEGNGLGSVLEDKVEKCTPRKFIVLDCKVSLNQVIGPPISAHLFTLVEDLSDMQVEVQVAEGDIGKVRVGLDADFTLSSSTGSDQVFHGKVTAVRQLPSSEQGAIFYKVLVEAPREQNLAGRQEPLRPGLTATVDIICRRREGAWKMPTTALSFQPEESQMTAAARAKLERWQSVKDRDHWRPVWIVGEDKQPWPIFVRVGGKNARGETGIRDLSFQEVLEWDPEISVKPDPAAPTTFPRAIIAAPPPAKGGLFNPPKIKF